MTTSPQEVPAAQRNEAHKAELQRLVREELEEMENFAFCHDDSWGNEYAMPNINWEQHREAIEKIKKELDDGPPPTYLTEEHSPCFA